MKNNLTQSILTITLTLFLIAILFYTVIHSSNDISTGAIAKPELSKTERNYVANNKRVYIGVDSNLLYLINDKDYRDSYLYECLYQVLSPAGLDPVLVSDSNAKATDCQLTIVTPHYRETAGDISYTAPIFEIEGALFINTNAPANEGSMRGSVVKNHITGKKLEDVTIDSKELDFVYADTNKAAVRRALNEDLAFVIGDADAIHAIEGASQVLQQQEEVLYRRNVCLIVPAERGTLYSILNASVHCADRHQITYALAKKWFDGNAPIYMKNDYSDVYFLIVILFAAVLFAFFIYYFTNRNMYRELSDRMQKLTESRKELQTTFNGVGYHLAELDLSGKILDINKAFAEHLRNKLDDSNFNCGSEYAGSFIWDVLGFNDDQRTILEQALTDAISGKVIDRPEITVGNKIYSIDIFPIDGARGKVDKLLFVGMDITGERMAERQMLQDNKMIAVGQLAAGVAHEIRNPLGIIRNYCYVIKNFSDDKVRADAVEQIEKAVDSSNKIITNLLGFSRRGSGYLQTVHVHDRIESIVTIARKSASSGNVNITVSCPEKIAVKTNPEALNIILINLVQNAMDANASLKEDSSQGSVHIEAKACDYALQISVRDTGCGIEPEALEEIFNPFYTTKGTHGTGLGLYIVYNEIEKLNGTIDVKSKLGEGTDITFTLPGVIDSEA